jgi:hypothetical protein
VASTEGARGPLTGAAGRTASPWTWLVAGCALLLVCVGGAGAAWWAASSETRVTSYRVLGTLAGIELDFADADAEVAGGALGAVEVRRTDRFAFGNPSAEAREVRNGVLRIRSQCPKTVPDTCRAAYRVEVPDNVPVTIRTGSGDVRLSGFRGSAQLATGSGAIAVSGFCGFALRATAGSGDVRVGTACSPERLELRSGSGGVRAVVPPGRYRVDAVSDTGSVRVRGVMPANDAAFQIQALSAEGDVVVESGA